MKTIAALSVLLLAAGCTTPYPERIPVEGATVSANPNPRGSDAFCREYARQTTANQYEGQTDAGEGFGSSSLELRRAELAGDRAYERCRAGRTN